MTTDHTRTIMRHDKDILTSQEEFEELHDILSRTQTTSKTCRVPVEALRHLLMDHSRMYGHIFPQMSGFWANRYKGAA